MNWKNKIKEHWVDISYLPLLASAAVTTLVVSILYSQTQEILIQRLRERLVAIAGTSAVVFSDEVDEIRTEQDLNKPVALEITRKMKAIRRNNINVIYVYMLRKTDNPEMTEFIVDADTIEPIDWDGNGQIDEIEVPPVPGEEYDVSEILGVQEAFLTGQPTANQDLYSDKWGTFLSGFAPIKNKYGQVIAVIGIDVEVSDYSQLVRAQFIPFFLLAVLLLLVLTVQTLSLVRIWRNRVELVKELDNQKDELLSMVSHQLATPVSSVKWYVEMLLDKDLGPLNKEQVSNLETVQMVTTELSELVNMILNVSRIQLGKVKVDKEPTDLNEFVKEILTIIEPKAKEKEVELKISIPDKVPEVKIDRRLTKMALENLLSNAVKYTPKKGKVGFSIKIQSKRILVSVSDTGCGIPKTEQPKIFEKLFRASNVKNVIEGNGFGLYLAKGAIIAQDGKIYFESKEGVGTTFKIEMPQN